MDPGGHTVGFAENLPRPDAGYEGALTFCGQLRTCYSAENGEAMMHDLPITGRAAMTLSLAQCVLTLLILARALTSTPAAAQSPGPTTNVFDGTYAGISREYKFDGPVGHGHHPVCELEGIPESLIISNGVIRSVGDGGFQGNVNSQGVAVIRTPQAFRINAQIDAHGTIRGSDSGTGGCVNTFVWRKQSR
jgi:hypothetical protein